MSFVSTMPLNLKPRGTLGSTVVFPKEGIQTRRLANTGTRKPTPLPRACQLGGAMGPIYAAVRGMDTVGGRARGFACCLRPSSGMRKQGAIAFQIGQGGTHGVGGFPDHLIASWEPASNVRTTDVQKEVSIQTEEPILDSVGVPKVMGLSSKAESFQTPDTGVH